MAGPGPLTPLREEPKRTMLVLALGVSSTLCALGLAVSSAWLIVRAAQRPPVLSLSIVMGLVQLFALGRAALKLVERLLLHDLALRCLVGTRLSIFQAIERLVPGGLGVTRDTELVTASLDDIDRVEKLYVGVVPPLVVGTLAGVLAIAFAGAMAFSAAVVLGLGFVIGAAGLPWLAQRLAGQRDSQRIELLGHRQAVLDQILRSGVELTCSPALDGYLDELELNRTHIARIEQSLATRRGLIAGLSTLVGGLTLLGTTVLSVEAVAHHHLAVSLIAIIPLLSLALMEIALGMADAAHSLPAGREACRRLGALEQRPGIWPDPEDGGVDVSQAKGLRTQQLSIGYDGRLLIEQVNLSVEPGSRIVIMGPSGSGKSSLLNTLARFVKPMVGDVTLGGESYEGLTGAQVRTVVATMDQEPHMFATNVRANLRMASPHASDDAVDEVIARLGLGIRFADGDGAIGEEGSALSGGERRRVGLGRVLLSDAHILILDEPTEGLDDVTASAVMTAIDDLAGSRALIVVTHRDRDTRIGTTVLELSDSWLQRMESIH